MPGKTLPVAVVEGQVWKDNDPRRPDRLLKVTYVEPLKWVAFQVIATKKKTVVRWHRLRQSSAKKGYSLVASPASASIPEAPTNA